MIELGGSIKLDGFDNIEPSKLVVIKKIVGNFVKSLESDNKVNSLTLKLEQDNGFKITAELDINEKKKNSSVTNDNLFFAINNALNKLNT